MKMGKKNGGAAPAASANAGKSRKPRIKGKNKPKNMHKAFRSSGNT